MIVSKVSLNCDTIRDRPTFHDEFARVFGFLNGYGRNMDAWIDCMQSLDAPDDAMSAGHCLPASVLTLELKNAESFRKRCPEQYDALIRCAEFVNEGRIEVGESAVLALSLVD